MSFIVLDGSGNQQIPPIQIAQINTFYDLYVQVANQIGTNSFQLFVQGETGEWGILPSDNTQNYFGGCQQQIQIVIQFADPQQQQNQPNQQGGQQIQLIVFVDGQQALSSMIPIEYPISQFIQEFGNGNGTTLYFQSACDSISQPVNLDTNQTFQAYLQYQPLILNLSTTQQQPQQIFNQQQQNQNNQQSPLKQQSSDEVAKQTLDNLIVLDDVSLIFDPSGKFLAYKFHQPIKVQGYLTESKSTNRLSNLASNQGWVNRGKVSFMSIDKKGFAVKWGNGNVSKVSITLQ